MKNRNEVLGPVARARMDAMLPGLLRAVRARRRRRAAFAAGGALLLAGLVAGSWLAAWDPAAAPPPRPQRWQPARVCEVVRDDPTVLARFAAAPRERAEWFVDDAGLQQFLRDSARPAGIVRVSGRARVASAALDPFPTATE